MPSRPAARSPLRVDQVWRRRHGAGQTSATLPHAHGVAVALMLGISTAARIDAMLGDHDHHRAITRRPAGAYTVRTAAPSSRATAAPRRRNASARPSRGTLVSVEWWPAASIRPVKMTALTGRTSTRV